MFSSFKRFHLLRPFTKLICNEIIKCATISNSVITMLFDKNNFEQIIVIVFAFKCFLNV